VIYLLVAGQLSPLPVKVRAVTVLDFSRSGSSAVKLPATAPDSVTIRPVWGCCRAVRSFSPRPLDSDLI
jgi:hypothetical protein